MVSHYVAVKETNERNIQEKIAGRTTGGNKKGV